jgi:hypothetical protein
VHSSLACGTQRMPILALQMQNIWERLKSALH